MKTNKMMLNMVRLILMMMALFLTTAAHAETDFTAIPISSSTMESRTTVSLFPTIRKAETSWSFPSPSIRMEK